MPRKLEVFAATPPVVEPVAFMSKTDGSVYIPGRKEDGGGCYEASTGKFYPADYSTVTVWNQYTPLYAGTKIRFMQEIAL